MSTMTLQERIDHLEDALASGVKKIKYDDVETEFVGPTAMYTELERLKRLQSGAGSDIRVLQLIVDTEDC